jgi:hypothetical protein
LINKFLELLGLPPINIGNPPVGGPSPTPGDTTPAPTTGNITTPVPGSITPAPTTKPCPINTPTTTVPNITLAQTTPPVVTLAPSVTLGTPTITLGANNGVNANVKVTFYTAGAGGPVDGSPVAYPPYPKAGGTGTYSDPLTFAAADGAYTPGTKIYVPLVQKYFISQDKCAGCVGTQVDLYVGNPSNTIVADNCAIALTPPDGTATAIVINPPGNLTYDPVPIWNSSNTSYPIGCMTPHR